MLHQLHRFALFPVFGQRHQLARGAQGSSGRTQWFSCIQILRVELLIKSYNRNTLSPLPRIVPRLCYTTKASVCRKAQSFQISGVIFAVSGRERRSFVGYCRNGHWTGRGPFSSILRSRFPLAVKRKKKGLDPLSRASSIGRVTKCGCECAAVHVGTDRSWRSQGH